MPCLNLIRISEPQTLAGKKVCTVFEKYYFVLGPVCSGVFNKIYDSKRRVLRKDQAAPSWRRLHARSLTCKILRKAIVLLNQILPGLRMFVPSYKDALVKIFSVNLN